VGAGNIVAALGLKDTCTGDTLLVPAKGNKKAHKGQHAKVSLPPLPHPTWAHTTHTTHTHTGWAARAGG
jgi:translation elongation factor EF-G